MSAFFDEVRNRYADPDRFVQRLRTRMALHGVTQAAIARRSGFDPPLVSEWLGSGDRKRRRRPSLESMVILDESLDRILNGD